VAVVRDKKIAHGPVGGRCARFNLRGRLSSLSAVIDLI
jgi:hypothetical protein